MATTTPAAPYQPTDDNDARLAAFQILGSDITTPQTWNGDWHEALRTASALWSGEPVWTCRICHTPNSHWTDTCGHCAIFHAP